MALKNALLVALKDQCVYVTEPGSIAADGLREGFLELGTVTSRDLAIEVATAVLAVQSHRRSSIVVDPLPRYAPDGFRDFQLGDTFPALGNVRVVGLTIAMDDEGRASVIPELQDRVAVAQEEVDRLLRRLADGGLSGETEQSSRAEASPVLAKPGRVKKLEAVSFDGPLVAGLISPPQNPPAPMQICHIITNLRIEGSTATGIRIVDENGNVRCSVTIPANRKLYAVDIYPPEYVSPVSQLMVDIPTAGVGAEALTVEIQVTTA